MSGYATSIAPKDAFYQETTSSTSSYTSSEIIKNIINNKVKKFILIKKLRYVVKLINKGFLNIILIERLSKIPLLMSDGIVIPKIGLRQHSSVRNL